MYVYVQKKMMAHDDVTCGLMTPNILKIINGLATRIELTYAILVMQSLKKSFYFIKKELKNV